MSNLMLIVCICVVVYSVQLTPSVMSQPPSCNAANAATACKGWACCMVNLGHCCGDINVCNGKSPAGGSGGRPSVRPRARPVQG